MELHTNYFTLFGLAPAFVVDSQALATRYRELQRQYHPDRFAHQPEQQQEAVLATAHINTAYQSLLDPVKRASYLLELQGQAVNLSTSIADHDFLMSQLELREQLDEAETPQQLEALRLEVQEWLESLAREFALDYADEDWLEARDTVRKLHFMANFLIDIKSHEDRLADDDWDDLDDDDY